MTAQIYDLEAYRMKRKAKHVVGALSHALANDDYTVIGGRVIPFPRVHGYMTEREMQRVARRLRLLHTAAERRDFRDHHVDLWDSL